MSRRKSLPSWSLRSGGETDDGHMHRHGMSAVTALKKLERERERGGGGPRDGRVGKAFAETS